MNQVVRFASLAAFVLVGFLTTGCMEPLPYDPNAQVVKELGPEEAKERLKEVLLRSIDPRIVAAEVTEEYFRYSARLEGAYGIPMGAHPYQYHYVSLGRLDLYENNKVFLYDQAGHELAVLLFGSGQDAMAFVDLVTSFKNRRLNRPDKSNDTEKETEEVETEEKG